MFISLISESNVHVTGMHFLVDRFHDDIISDLWSPVEIVTISQIFSHFEGNKQVYNAIIYIMPLSLENCPNIILAVDSHTSCIRH